MPQAGMGKGMPEEKLYIVVFESLIAMKSFLHGLAFLTNFMCKLMIFDNAKFGIFDKITFGVRKVLAYMKLNYICQRKFSGACKRCINISVFMFI